MRQRIATLPGWIQGIVLSLATIALFWFGLDFIADLDNPSQLWAGVLDLFGADARAEGVRRDGINDILAKAIVGIVALVIGTVGIWMLYVLANTAVDSLSSKWQNRIRPWIFIGPALIMLGFFLIYPIVDTTWTSITEDVDGVGLGNYQWAVTDDDLRIAFRNNVLWLVFATGGSVILGLLVATLVDRIKREALAKTFIFLPLAISFVGASVIWKFVYAWRPEGQPQIGILNAAVTSAGAEPIAWTIERPLNTFALILIMVWLQTGFAMVIFSAALKNVPTEIIEASRLDGANEFQLFFRVVLPMIRGTVITVATTIFIAVLKVFDVVFVMTGGRFDTEVVANRMFTEMFTFRNFGRASTLAVLLLIVVAPIMVLNVRNLRQQGFAQ